MDVKNCDNLSISPWIQRFSHLLPEPGCVLDLAAGGGRHSRWLLEDGHHVLAIDRDINALKTLRADMASGMANESRLDFEIIQADLEDGSAWPLKGREFKAVIVVNYLFRPLFPHLVRSLAPNGLLLYDTFAVGQEVFGRPTNPDFLLRPGELLEVAAGQLEVIAFEHGEITSADGPSVKQRMAAIKGVGPKRLTLS